jgi:hypothetical protein
MKKTILSGIVLLCMALSALTACTTVVRTPPPAAKVQIVPAPPFKGAVWADGYWKHKRGTWIWVPGHWKKLPPH